MILGFSIVGTLLYVYGVFFVSLVTFGRKPPLYCVFWPFAFIKWLVRESTNAVIAIREE